MAEDRINNNLVIHNNVVVSHNNNKAVVNQEHSTVGVGGKVTGGLDSLDLVKTVGTGEWTGGHDWLCSCQIHRVRFKSTTFGVLQIGFAEEKFY